MDTSIVPQNDFDLWLAHFENEGRIVITDDGIDIWVTPDEMSRMFGVTVQAISLHINSYRKQDPDGFKSRFKESLNRNKPRLYNLDILIYVGYRVNSTYKVRQFRDHIASMVRTQLAERITRLKEENDNLRQVNRWLATEQRSGEFITRSLPSGDRD